jgi:hypothetical protein
MTTDNNKMTRAEALDIDRCAYDNCYDDVYGVVQVPFDIALFEGDSHEIDYENGKKHRFYVNTPLCKVHFHQVPAMAYPWEKEDHENLE